MTPFPRLTLRFSATCVVTCVAALALSAPAAKAAEVTFGLPGIPPVFLAVQEYVAQDAGFFKKYGVDVKLRPFDTGAAAARATASGDIDFTVSPTPVVINMVGNANVPLIGIYGLENPDWLIASFDPAVKTCKDLAGKPIGVDTPGGARSVALRQITAPCGLKIEDMQQVSLGSNTSSAMIAGQIVTGVLHLDDLSVIEAQAKKKLTVVTTLTAVKPVSHYNLFAVRKDKLAANRDAYVKIVAALIDAEKYMRDPKNADKVAEMAKPTGRTVAEAKDALQKYLDLKFWPTGTDGLGEKNIDIEIKTQVAVGGIQQGKTPPTFQGLVDLSVYKDALALTQKK
jgi:ABC-type nitrate/sulfonate/bicarbonate transport system substrate-binding protein